MKVYMGPYTNRWRSTIYTKYMTNKHGYDWNDDNTRFESFLEKLEDVLQDVYNATINKILDKRERKIKVHIDGYDIWSADNTIALIVHPLLLKLREHKHGAPLVDDEDVPEHLRSTSANPKENEWDTDDNHFKRWDYVLDEMIWAFEQCTDADHGAGQFYSGEVDWNFQKDSDTGLSSINYGPNHTFACDDVGREAHFKRIKNGLRLFGKYYMALWD